MKGNWRGNSKIGAEIGRGLWSVLGWSASLGRVRGENSGKTEAAKILQRLDLATRIGLIQKKEKKKEKKQKRCLNGPHARVSALGCGGVGVFLIVAYCGNSTLVSAEYVGEGNKPTVNKII